MPAHDIYHDLVRTALRKDGWTITAEDYTIPVGLRRVYIDLQAERDVIAATQGNEMIAVEVKSFVGTSSVKDLRDAIGQYALYRAVLRRFDPLRVPYLAIDLETAQTIFAEPLAEYLVADLDVALVIVDIVEERIIEWRR